MKDTINSKFKTKVAEKYCRDLENRISELTSEAEIARLIENTDMNDKQQIKDLIDRIEEHHQKYSTNKYTRKLQELKTRKEKIEKADKYIERKNTGCFVRMLKFLLGIVISLGICVYTYNHIQTKLFRIIIIFFVICYWIDHFIEIKEGKKYWKELNEDSKK